MLVDNVEIVVKAGNGGSGLASFRREKFEPFGGPDGGDGGKGGNVFLEADADITDLATFKHRLTYKAENGGVGGKNQMHGLNGTDLNIKIPVGTTAYVKMNGELVQKADFTVKGQRVMVAKGGKGGQGNVHYATATRKAPRIFQPGKEGDQCNITMEIWLPVDIGIVGLPNSGKSSLLAALSGAKPQVAEYYFTTQEPVLGAVDDGQKKYIWAEIPAIIEGSHSGKGLGNGFLKHLSRAKVLVYLLDATSPQMEEDLACLKREVEAFNPEFAWKKYVVAVNKTDAVEDQGEPNKLFEKLASEGVRAFPVSAGEKAGLKELVADVHKLVADEEFIQMEEPAPEVIFRPRPVDR
jgi:GTP-binding protein